MFRTRSVPLPRHVATSLKEQGKGVSNRIAVLIAEEASRNRPLQPLDRADIEYVPVRLDVSLLDAVRTVKSRFPEIACSEGEIVSRLVLTALNGSPTLIDEEPAPSSGGCGAVDIHGVIASSRFSLRAEQLDLCGHLEKACASGKVALLESATGTGKGLVIAATAATMANSGFRTLICAPSHQVNAQIRRHFADGDVQAGDHVPVSVFGRAQFFSPSVLAFMLEAGLVIHEHEAAVKTLLDRDLERYSQGNRSSVFHLEDLRAIWPHHSHLEAALAPQIDDEATRVYEHQFEAARASRIVLATHSMVALDFNLRRMNAVRDLGFVKEESIDEESVRLVTHAFDGILGRFDALLVDEAHLFEPNVAAAMSDSVSVYMTKSRIERYGSREATQLARKSYDTLARLGSGNEDLVLKQGVDTDEQTALRSALSDLKTAITLSVKKRSMPPDVKATLVRTADTIGRALTLRNQLSTLRFSPTQRYPRLMTGPASVARIVANFWQSASWGAALSATLYTRDMGGNANAGFMSRRLRIPMARLLTHTPMVPSWTVSPVTLIRSQQPEGDLKQHPMFPPAAHDAEDEAVSSTYFDALSTAINHALSDALGGALVLCTSYQAIQGLSERSTHPQRVMTSIRGTPVSTLLREFQTKALAGERPIWFATGPAWTGLDIYAGINPPPVEQDHLLSDLVVPRLPFQMAISSTDQARRQYMPSHLVWPDQVLQCSFRLLQGIGRLVRREGLPPKNLWVFDPRGFDPTYAGSSIRSIWARYRKQVTFSETRTSPPVPVKPAQPVGGIRTIVRGRLGRSTAA